MVRTKRDNYLRAVQRLGEALEEYAANPTDTVRDGVIQRFEFTFDLAWKSLKEYMQDQGATTPLQFPKQVLREAYAAELIDDERLWLDMLDARNSTSHIYDDRQAAAVMSGVQERYYKALRALASLYGDRKSVV